VVALAGERGTAVASGAMRIEHLRPSGTLDTVTTFQYSQAVRVGDLLLVAGQAGWNERLEIPADYADECRAVFDNLATVLRAAGCDFGDVVDAVSLHAAGTDLAAFWAVRNEYIRAPWPAWTTIGDIALAFPTMHVEIKVTAVVPS
jgi:enamine deaminase RidA (YjgF/YER057c/UK114 family)